MAARALTFDEERLRRRRVDGFDRFLTERMLVLADFAEHLGLPAPAIIVATPADYVDRVGTFLQGQQTDDEQDRLWLTTRLGYLVGEVLIQRLGGHWFVNEIPDSRYFLHYVVGSFPQAHSPTAMIDPFVAADHFVRQPVGRNLSAFVKELIDEVVVG